MTTIWVDAQLSPRLASWMSANFPVQASALRDIDLRDAEDADIFDLAKLANAVIMTKDSDFVDLLERKGSPPRVIWLTCGNTSEFALQTILQKHLFAALTMLEAGETLVEIYSP
jgi:predicted nuclease of predicted toxin-antitoxin system